LTFKGAVQPTALSWPTCIAPRPELADIVAKVFLHDQSRNLLAVGATFE
jgi:hypothetical protein